MTIKKKKWILINKKLDRVLWMIALFLFYRGFELYFNSDNVVYAYMAVTTYYLIELRG